MTATRVRVQLRDDRVAVPELRAGDALVPRILDVEGRRIRIALVGRCATLLAGDRVEVAVAVGPGVELELVEPSGTVAYDGRGAPASWAARIEVGPGGALLWNAAPFVIARGADVPRDLHVDLADGAFALLSELLVLGRSGEAGGALLARQRVHRAGRPLLVEDLDLRDAVLRALPGVLGQERVLGSVALLGLRPEHIPGPHATPLAGPGALARVLAPAVHCAQPVVEAFWREWRGLVQAAGTSTGS
ncbi:urease accessory protein UreD [Brachybacterium hainanense]|uniref:Urease accessory protein UreD n=1 Tax=Brachybacterium hainanense TaxID=1541174 RepID=A0ABV6RCI8_9MICO